MVLSGPTGLTLLQMIAEKPELSGVKLNYSVATKPEQLTARLVSGEADIAALPTNLAAVLYNRDRDPVGGGYQLGVTYLLGRDPSVRSWQGLKGRELAVTGRGTTRISSCATFKGRWIGSEKDLKLQYYAAPVDWPNWSSPARLTWQPCPTWVTSNQEEPEVSVLLDYRRHGNAWSIRDTHIPRPAWWSAELAGKNPELVRDFLAAAAAVRLGQQPPG